MDPNECLKRIDTFLANRQSGNEVDEWCEDLSNWIKIGGFDPDWSKYPLGESYFKCHQIQKRIKS